MRHARQPEHHGRVDTRYRLRWYPQSEYIKTCVAEVIIMRTKVPLGTTARTGERCPESGVWEVVGTPTTTAPIAEGNVMPPYSGKAVTWRLIRYA